MKIRSQFQVAAGLALTLSIVVAEGVVAHSPLPAAPDLPLFIDGANEPAPPAPLSGRYRLPDSAQRYAPSQRVTLAPGATQLLPNWEVGRRAATLLPNYEPGTATFELLHLDAISGLAPLVIAPSAAAIAADKP